ncbi:hypothetical protein PAXRUDRAFT_429131 [Paxillus rubicundulus Ve08.2h10]|uniref:Uncharacterized protein n=1 Tax=Paxillus rubicundulus Ve08.2h10 TaxID=930991 RepID=A0A0D0CZ09_9AGAM|nr:hypothetical protein PAXRUDRAFT_429131 [Paxillus rubicundulus Ve08.2h10]
MGSCTSWRVLSRWGSNRVVHRTEKDPLPHRPTGQRRQHACVCSAAQSLNISDIMQRSVRFTGSKTPTIRNTVKLFTPLLTSIRRRARFPLQISS